MSDENPKPTIKINIDKFTSDIRKEIKEEFAALAEHLTPEARTISLNEAHNRQPEIIENWDWKSPIEKRLTTWRQDADIFPDYWDNRLKISEITERHYDEKDKENKYNLKLNEKLSEQIGTIAQGTANCCIPEIWADKIERDHIYPGSVFLGAWFVNWYTEIQGKPGDRVHICRVGPALCADMTCAEPTVDAPTIACPHITLEHDVCAYAICKNDIETVQFGLVDALNEGLGSCLQVCVDNYFFDVALSCANAGTLISAAPMTGSLLLEAMGSMLANIWLWMFGMGLNGLK